jgi:hypothetical protein
MPTYSPMLAKQKGFSLLTGFILSIIMFGTLAFFLAGQGINAGFGTNYSNTSKVSGLLTSGGYINTGFDAVTMGGTTPASVTFDVTALTGVFNPTSGGASPQSLDPTLFQGRAGAAGLLDGYWIYRGSAVTLNGVGTAAADYTMMVSGLKLSVCQQINNTLHGTALTIAPTTLTAFTDALLLGTAPLPTAATPTQTTTAADLSALGTSGWMNGCYATTTAGNYVYIHTLLAQ